MQTKRDKSLKGFTLYVAYPWRKSSSGSQEASEVLLSPLSGASPEWNSGVYMKRFFASLSAVAIVGTTLVFAQPAQAAGGGEALAVSHLGRVSVTVGDGEFDGDTAKIPLKFAYERWGNDYADVAITVNSLNAKQVGARSDIGVLYSFVNWSYGAAQSGTGDASISISGPSFIPNQPVLIYGSATFTRYGEGFTVAERIEVAFPPVLTVNIAQDETTIRDVRVGPRSISGKATVESVFGTIGAGGDIYVRYRAPGDKRWTYVTEFEDCPSGVCLAVDPMGDFNFTMVKPIPPRSRVELTVADCGWCTPAKQTVTRGRK